MSEEEERQHAEELRAQVLALQLRIAEDRATFEEELGFARSVIIQLQEDIGWVRDVADNREERVLALEAELSRARFQLEALMSSGRKDKQRIGKIVLGLLTGVAAVAEFSGLTLKEVVDRPSSPLSAIVVTISPEDCSSLGFERPRFAAGTGIANATGKASLQPGGALPEEFTSGSFRKGTTTSPGAWDEDLLSSLPSEAHVESPITDAATGPLGAGVASATSHASGTLGTTPADDGDNTDKMVREFLRQRLNEKSDPVRPDMIADALPIGIDEVHSSLVRLHQAEAIEGVTVEEFDYPVMVTAVTGVT